MTVLLTEITNVGSIPMLEKTLAFTEARNRMLATNIANILTPGYRTKQLDVASFQKALRDAAEQRRREGGDLELRPTREVGVDDAGRLQITPSEEPTENLLFQDGTNARIERQMALLAENAMMNRVASELLRNRLDGVAKAILGKLK